MCEKKCEKCKRSVKVGGLVFCKTWNVPGLLEDGTIVIVHPSVVSYSECTFWEAKEDI